MMDHNTLDRLMAGANGNAYDAGLPGVAGGGGMGIGAAGAAGTRSAAGSGVAAPGSSSAGDAGAGQMIAQSGSGAGQGGGGGSDGGFVVTPEMCMDPQLADKVFKTDYFILDFQTHHTNEGSPGPVSTTAGGAVHESRRLRAKIFERATRPSPSCRVTREINARPTTWRVSFRNEDMRARAIVNKAAMLNAMAAERMVAHRRSSKNNPMANAG
jgi:hypothetical protein